jgi:hypothetical protein
MFRHPSSKQRLNIFSYENGENDSAYGRSSGRLPSLCFSLVPLIDDP